MLANSVNYSHLTPSLPAYDAGKQPVAGDPTSSLPAQGLETHAPAPDGNRPAAIYVRMERYHSTTYSLASLQQTEKAAEVEQPAAGAIKASSTILNFIEAQLARDLEEGATIEALESRLQAGLEGFEKGYGEALEILQQTEGMSDKIWDEIAQTQTLVREGIEALKQRYIEGSSAIDNPKASRGESANVATAEPERPASVERHYGVTEVAQQNRFAFELVTADGDTVVINATSLRASIMETYVSQMDNVQERMFEGQAQKDRFSLQIKGDLDEQELKAINDLLNQVGDLSDEFFAGNLEQAFQMATTLGYDSAEISSFALNLSHTAVRKVTHIYESVKPERSQLQVVERLQALGDYINRFMQAYDTASTFAAPIDLMQQLSSLFDEDQSRRFSAAADFMLADLR